MSAPCQKVMIGALWKKINHVLIVYGQSRPPMMAQTMHQKRRVMPPRRNMISLKGLVSVNYNTNPDFMLHDIQARAAFGAELCTYFVDTPA